MMAIWLKTLIRSRAQEFFEQLQRNVVGFDRPNRNTEVVRHMIAAQPPHRDTPILEEGMTLQRIDFSASEQQFVEAAKLSLVTVAAAFHVNPTMIGQNDGANYSNVREFRRMLFTTPGTRAAEPLGAVADLWSRVRCDQA